MPAHDEHKAVYHWESLSEQSADGRDLSERCQQYGVGRILSNLSPELCDDPVHYYARLNQTTLKRFFNESDVLFDIGRYSDQARGDVLIVPDHVMRHQVDCAEHIYVQSVQLPDPQKVHIERFRITTTLEQIREEAGTESVLIGESRFQEGLNTFKKALALLTATIDGFM